VARVATHATTATTNTKKENILEQTIKEAIGTTFTGAPKKEETETRYPVYFSMKEMGIIEEVLYERASILDSMSEWQAYKKDHATAKRLERKAILLEKFAARFGLAIDTRTAEGVK
jgi:hypothetical protein